MPGGPFVAGTEAEAAHIQNTNAEQLLSGNIRRYVEEWKKITSNNFILRIVKEGYKLQFTSAPKQSHPIISNPKSKSYNNNLRQEIEKLLASGAVSPIESSTEHFVSRVFLVKKSNGDNRLIIDLSPLNMFISKIFFRMEGMVYLKHLIQKDDYMISIDLSEAFFSIPLHASCKKYVTFEFRNQRYCCNVMPFDLSSFPRIFCKVVRPGIIYLRSPGIFFCLYGRYFSMCSII